MAYRTIGKTLPRVEGYGKVTGQTQYAADLPFEGLLWAKVLRSPLPHARIRRLDASGAWTVDGPAALARAMPDWVGLSRVASVQSAQSGTAVSQTRSVV